MANSIDITARLVVTNGEDHIAVVGEGNYLIVNFPSQQALDRVTGSSQTGSSTLQTLGTINDLVRAVHMVVDVRVKGKTYVEFGSGNSPNITANAIFGKLGSFFKR